MSEQDVKIPGRSRKHFIISGLLLLVAALVVIVLNKGLNLNPMQVPSALINKPAKNFKVSWLQGQQFLPDAEGGSFSLADFKGKPLILNFWASWCFSCRHEARDFEHFWQNYKSTGLKVVGIAIQDSVPAAMKFAKTYGKTYILGLDVEGTAAIDYGVTGVPETFLIDENGVIIYKEAGPVSEEKLEKFAAILLKREQG